MGFFKALAPLLARGSITIRLSEEKHAGTVKLIITQVPDKEGDVGLPTLRHVDTPERLDEMLANEIAAVAAHRDGAVQSVLDQAKAAMDEAAAEEKRKADEKLASARKKPGTSKVATPKVTPQKFTLDSPEKGGEGGEAPGEEPDGPQEPEAPQGGSGTAAADSVGEDLFS